MWLPHRALSNKESTMNAQELMQGDLVLLFGDTPARVDAIGDTETYATALEDGAD